VLPEAVLPEAVLPEAVLPEAAVAPARAAVKSTVHAVPASETLKTPLSIPAFVNCPLISALRPDELMVPVSNVPSLLTVVLVGNVSPFTPTNPTSSPL